MRHDTPELIVELEDGSEVPVYNKVMVVMEMNYQVSPKREFNAHKKPVEIYPNNKTEGDPPKYVTPNVKKTLQEELGIEVNRHGIEVIDPLSDDVNIVL